MRRLRWIGLLAAGVGLAACGDRSGQVTPIAPGGATGSTSTTVSSSGGTVGHPGGLSLAVPAGAVSGAVTVGVQAQSASAPAGTGTPASPASFALQPAGQRLNQPAQVQLRLSSNLPDTVAATASLVVSFSQNVSEVGQASVDLANGVLQAPLNVLGTVVAVIPPPSAVVRLSYLDAITDQVPEPAPIGPASIAERLRLACDALPLRCPGASIEAPKELLRYARYLTVLYPQALGEFFSDPPIVQGGMTFRGWLRAIQGKAVASSLIELRLEATSTSRADSVPNGVLLRNIRYTARLDTLLISSGRVDIPVEYIDATSARVVARGAYVRIGGRDYPIRAIIPVRRIPY